MTDTPSEYHMKRAEELISSALRDNRLVKAVAKLIAKHEPEPVDPDLVLAREICGRVADEMELPISAKRYRESKYGKDLAVRATLAALKKGREQSGLRWIKHDGSGVCPVDDGTFCVVRFPDGSYEFDNSPEGWGWLSSDKYRITHYAPINLPEID